MEKPILGRASYRSGHIQRLVTLGDVQPWGSRWACGPYGRCACVACGGYVAPRALVAPRVYVAPRPYVRVYPRVRVW